jgi:hypothetical protein
MLIFQKIWENKAIIVEKFFKKDQKSICISQLEFRKNLMELFDNEYL